MADIGSPEASKGIVLPESPVTTTAPTIEPKKGGIRATVLKAAAMFGIGRSEKPTPRDVKLKPVSIKLDRDRVRDGQTQSEPSTS